jgi:penicillin-binding protein 1A
VKLGTRQVGSTAKPFVYAYAIDNGYGPCVSIPNYMRTKFNPVIIISSFSVSEGEV